MQNPVVRMIILFVRIVLEIQGRTKRLAFDLWDQQMMS